MGSHLDQLAAAVRGGERARETDRDREARIANHEMEFSDGFLSSWADGLSQQKAAIARELLANGGRCFFARYELVGCESGKVLDAKIVDGQFGRVWLNSSIEGSKFITAHTARRGTQEKKGAVERVVICEADAMVGYRGADKVNVRAVTYAVDEELRRKGAHRIGLTREDAEGWAEEWAGWREVRWEG